MTAEIRDAFAEHFPDELVKHRPGSATWAHREACPGKSCRETRDADKHMQFSYVEDEAVMDRLDDVLGIGAWQWSVEMVGPDVVRGSLKVRVEGEWTAYQDFGYCGNGSSAEPMKEASTDAFRRCGRMVGIARYIYAGEVTQAHRPGAAPSARPAAPSAGGGSPQPPPAPQPGEPEVTWDDLPGVAQAIFTDEDVCPQHSQPWKLVPAGVSKTSGNPYDAFWACPERGCKVKPTKAWQMRHEQ
jgi:hypothetical protein